MHIFTKRVKHAFAKHRTTGQGIIKPEKISLNNNFFLAPNLEVNYISFLSTLHRFQHFHNSLSSPDVDFHNPKKSTFPYSRNNALLFYLLKCFIIKCPQNISTESSLNNCPSASTK